MDAQGPEAVRPWLARAGANFPTVIDRENRLAILYGYKMIPNGIFLDVQGIIRYRKFGGFSVENAADVAAVRRLITGEAEQVAVAEQAAPYGLSEVERELIATCMRLGTELFARGRWRNGGEHAARPREPDEPQADLDGGAS